MSDASEIVVAGNGTIYVADAGVTPPDDLGTLDTDWTELGFVSEDGVSFTDSKTLENVGAWQSFYSVRRIITEKELTLSFALRQWNHDTVVLAFGGGVVTEDTGVFTYTPPAPEDGLDERALVVDWTDGDRNYRLVVPKGIVSEAVETTLARTAASDLPIAFSAIPDAGDDAFVLITDDPAFTPPATA